MARGKGRMIDDGPPPTEGQRKDQLSRLLGLLKPHRGRFFVATLALLGHAAAAEPPELRLNQIQVIGTHNSYHIAPAGALMQAFAAQNAELAASVDYTHRPLPEQFARLGIRQIELDLFASENSAREVGAGFGKIETGLRFHYAITGGLSPYIGVNYEAKLGETADFARADGEDPGATAFVAGVRFAY